VIRQWHRLATTRSNNFGDYAALDAFFRIIDEGLALR
jgi:hypothetical protein